MSFDWSEFLELAYELAQSTSEKSSEEARTRSAISRSYYAAYRIARDYWEKTQGRVVDYGRGSHGNLVQNYKLNQDKENRKVGVYLEIAFENRKNADYDALVPDLKSKLSVNLRLCKWVVEKLR